ncbi:MAG: hypothetical protein GY862_17540 [Gammaproteobacteria bacterium]|nr:hypothetical protein [Gammaproteobacteria bacterium]
MKYDILIIRFAYLETRLYWEDGLSAGKMAEFFDWTLDKINGANHISHME